MPKLPIWKKKSKVLQAKWSSEKSLWLTKFSRLKSKLKTWNIRPTKPNAEGDYGRVAEIRYGRIKALEAQIDDYQSELATMQGSHAMIKEEVDSEDIADVVSRWTGIPVNKMLQSEKEKAAASEDELQTWLVRRSHSGGCRCGSSQPMPGLQDPKASDWFVYLPGNDRCG